MIFLMLCDCVASKSSYFLPLRCLPHTSQMGGHIDPICYVRVKQLKSSFMYSLPTNGLSCHEEVGSEIIDNLVVIDYI